MGISKAHDASFYEFVAHVIQEHEKAQDRRSREREAFAPVQLVAPFAGDGELPTVDQFKPVKCRDLTVRGFSFLTDDPPAQDKLVVALGVKPEVAYLVAQVVHRTPVESPERYEYLIGCSFVKRLRA